MEKPVLRKKALAICLGDHGIASENVSAFPSTFTRLFAKVLAEGGAAINVFCDQCGFKLIALDFGVNGAVPESMVDAKVSLGTRNFSREAAMPRECAVDAIERGVSLACRDFLAYDIVALGEMGIANSSSASALLCAFTGYPPTNAVGPGSGVSSDVVARKVRLIESALERHSPNAEDPIGTLAALGGFEIAGIVGLCLGCALNRIPVIFDGFICTAAALVVQKLCPSALEYAFFSHRSSEPAHLTMLEHLGAEPIFDLGMRLGEGTGAVLAGSLVELGVSIFNGIFDREHVMRMQPSI